MSNHSGADAVISGAPYRVVTVNDRPAAALDDFVGDLVEVVARLGEQTVSIHGAGGYDEDRTVTVFEKTEDGTGKDVRRWHITQVPDGFEAVESPH